MAFLPASETGVGGSLVACDQYKPSADGVRVYLNGGEDLAVILARVERAGGKIVVPKTLIREDIGFFALFGVVSAAWGAVLAVGQQGIIEDVDAEDHFRQRLQALGFRIGKEVRPIRQALFGGPLQVRVGSVNIMLRRNDAALIYVWAEG